MKGPINIIQRMGCTSTTVVESRRIVALPPQAVNSYIDRFPAIILHKIKQKFEQFADKERKRLNIFHFIQLHSVTERSSDTLKRLFHYYTDYEDEDIAFRQFIIKYATLIKGEPYIVSSILFEIHKNSIDSPLMTQQEFNNFYENETFFFGKHPKPVEFPINLQNFSDILKECNFNWEEFQNKLTITTEEDIPFKMISREILDCDFNDLSIGKEYYILSNAWFHRWSFYYQQFDAKTNKERIKSTKFIGRNDEGSVVGRRYKKKEASMSERRMIDSLRTSQLNNTLIEQPKIIDFQDIEGQYRGELKENLKISAQIKIITDGLWKLLCKLHPPEQEFKRVAISQEKLEYYPKAIYYFQTDDYGELKPNSQTITLVSVTQKVSYLKNNKTSLKLGIFSKNFGQKNWRQLDERRSFAQVSLDARFFVVVASNRQKFIQKFYRKQIKKNNLQPGDLIYAHFPYIKSHSQAFVIKIGPSDTLNIHFKGYSFRYQLEIRTQDASIVQSEAALSSAKKKHESLIKGIANVGNTCFMNAIIECLVATPILDIFLSEYHFNEKKQPIGFGLSEVARALLRNEKADPKKFKRLIDANMSIFSGFEQHDAQQFLNLLLDKLSQEIPQKPTVIDYLFGGGVQSKLTCGSCKNTKFINQKMYILSLPIPEPEFNYFNIVVVPVTSKTLKKMIFKLHKSATVSEYGSAFEERSGYNRKDFVFVETSQNSLKKIKEQILRSSQQRKKITDIGIVPNVSLLAFEKIPFKFYSDIAMGKPESTFKELQPNPQAPWTICKILSSRSEKNQFVIEYVSPEGNIEKVRIDKDLFAGRSAKLGSKTQSTFKKILLRKYNSSLRKLEQFGLQFLVGVPLWASYEDLIKITERYIQNLKEKQARPFRQKKGGDYIIRLLYQYRCIFCQKQILMFSLDEAQITHCCEVFQKTIPLYWSSRSTNFTIFVDWIDFSKCNSMFCSYIQVDLISRNVQNTRQDEFVSLQSCIKLHNQTQSVEMECDTCKNKLQSLEHFIDKVPNILIIHMKEFRYTPEGHLIKIDLRLKWQQVLDSSKYSIDSNGKLYELFAVVKHSGNSESGHYTCLAKRKHPYENKKVWVLFDDDTTEITKQEQSFIDDVYLLCYKKVDMPTSGSIMYADIDRL